MTNLLRWAGALALILMPCLASAQSTGSSVQFPAGYAPSTSLCVKQGDGTCVPVSVTNALPVTLPSGSTIEVTCAVVSGDQAYTVGSVQPATCTSTGRLKVGLSSAGNVDPAAQLATTLTADLIGCKYRATTAWTLGWTGSLSCASDGSLLVSNATVGASTDAKSTATDTTPASEIALLKGQIDRLAAILAQLNTDASGNLYYTPRNGTTSLSTTSGTSVVIAPSANVGYTFTPCVSASAAATSVVCKASAGNYYDGYCQSSAAGRCILYNATTVPSAGALTASLVLECAVVPAGGTGGWSYGALSRRASAGAVVLFSTGADCNTYTASSTAYIRASVM